MAPRPRHPLKSVFFFLVVCGLAGAAYMNRDKLKGNQEVAMPAEEERLLIKDAILEQYEKEECFVAMRGDLLWRANEKRYRLDIEVDAGCDRDAKSLVADIARLIQMRSGKAATVFAYDVTDREVARKIL